MRFVVVYDACVLYPAPLRDFLVPGHDGVVCREMERAYPRGMDAEYKADIKPFGRLIRDLAWSDPSRPRAGNLCLK